MKKIINSLRENWFRVSLILVVFIAILVCFFSWKFAQEKKEALANNIKCQQEGVQLYEKEKKSLLRDEITTDPEFRFSKKLNTCLLMVTIIGSDETGSSLTAFIKDVYSNQDLASYTSYNIRGQEPSLYGDKEKYEALKELYFSN